MSKFLLVIMIICVTAINACGNFDDYAYEQPNLIDPELQGYYDEFAYEAARHGMKIGTIKMTFNESLEDNNPGRSTTCIPGRDDAEFNPRWFADSKKSDIKKKFVVFHELGHGLLCRDHDDEVINVQYDGQMFLNANKSIMSTYVINDDKYLISAWSDLVDELFENAGH